MSNLNDAAIPEIAATDEADVWGVIVGDVSGHGVAAAAEAMQFDAILRTFEGDGGPPPASAIRRAQNVGCSRDGALDCGLDGEWALDHCPPP